MSIALRCALGVFSLALLLASAPAHAGGFRIVTEENPPFNYTENNEPKGFATELLQAALRDLGKDLPIEFLPWERAYGLALSEPGVLIFTMARKPERESLFLWVAPVHPRTMYLYKLKSRSDIQIKTVEEAKRYRVGTKELNDAATIDLLNLGFEPGKNLELLHGDHTQNILKLAAGRVDLIVTPEMQMVYGAKATGHSPAEFEKIFRISPEDEEYYFAFSKGTAEETVEQLRSALEKLRKNGTYEALRKKYMQ